MNPAQFTMKARETEQPIPPEVFQRAAQRTSQLHGLLMAIEHLVTVYKAEQLLAEIFDGTIFPEPIQLNPDEFTDDQLTHEDLRFIHGFLGTIVTLPTLYEVAILSVSKCGAALDPPTKKAGLKFEFGQLEWYIDLMEHSFFMPKEKIWKALLQRRKDAMPTTHAELPEATQALVAEHGQVDDEDADDDEETHQEYLDRMARIEPDRAIMNERGDMVIGLKPAPTDNIVRNKAGDPVEFMLGVIKQIPYE